MSGLQFKVIGKHRKDCWGHEAGGFCCFEGVDRERDKAGRYNKNGSCEWFCFRCNDPSCTAVAIVRWDAVAEFVNRGTAERRAHSPDGPATDTQTAVAVPENNDREAPGV